MRFSAGGEDDGNEGESSTSGPSSKRPRTLTSLVGTSTRTDALHAAAISAAASAAVASVVAEYAANIATNPNAPLAPRVQTVAPNAVEAGSDEETDRDSDRSYSGFGQTLSSRKEEEEQEQGLEQPIGGTTEGRVSSAAVIPRGSASTPVSVTLTDPDVLDCPICLEPLCPPVYQCENGHIACASCCTNMRNKCAPCSLPIGYNRCRAIEKILDSAQICCKNLQHGCKESLHYSKKLDHEKTCIYTPCACPYQGCNYVLMSKALYTHFAAAHSRYHMKIFLDTVSYIKMEGNQKNLFLQETAENILFILDRTVDTPGSLICVICIAPTWSTRLFPYEIAARYGETCIRIKSVAENIPKWTPQARMKKYFLVPKDFCSSPGSLTLELIIRRVAK